MLYCCRRVQSFTSIYENYVAQEIDLYENEHYFEDNKDLPATNILFASSLNLYQNSSSATDHHQLKSIVNKNGPSDETELMFNG